MYCQQYIPTQVLAGVIVSLLKSKVKNLATSSNYKPIAIATVLTKAVKVLLHRLEAYLYIVDS